MADDKKLGGTTPELKTEASTAAPKPEAPATPKPVRRSASADAADAIREVGGTTDAQAEELAAAGVDPKLDNRIGDQRPATNPAPKPQQVPGND